MKKKYPKLYMIIWNKGGNLNNNIYTLFPRKDDFEDGYNYWDKTDNIGFGIEDKIKLNVIITRDGYWQYITPDKEKADLIFLGAKTTKKFFQYLIS